MNIITTEQLVAICCKAAANGYTKPACMAARLVGGEDPLEFCEALMRCQPGDYVHICKGARGQDDYKKLDQFVDGLPVWETEPQQYADDWAEEMLRHHG